MPLSGRFGVRFRRGRSSRRSRRTRVGLGLTGILLVALTLVSCTAAGPSDRGATETAIADLRPADLDPGERLRVVATTTIVADVVQHVGGADISFDTLLPMGIDPHAYEPTPQDRRILMEAHIVVMNGLGLEPFLASGGLLADVPAPLVALSEGLRTIAATDARQGVDPHVWLDPANVKVWAENAAEALGRLDPTNAEAYRQRAAGYLLDLQSLEGRLQAQIDLLPPEERKLVTDHESLGYFAARYGFEIIGAVIPSPSNSAEASARGLAGLEEAIRREGVRAVFVSSSTSPELAQRVADDTGVRLVPLYLESLTELAGPAPTYLELMDYNVAAIVQALLE